MNINLTNKQRFYVVETLKIYWPNKPEIILKLPIPHKTKKDLEPLPPLVKNVKLPKWAADIGVNGKILVPVHYIVKKEEPLWKHVDWLGVIFWYLNGLAERAFEKLYGPIHSYSFRLKGWNSRLWEHAWVNRIALFLRRWAAKEQGVNENTLFGPLPKPEIILTHDVDAISKTMAVRFKQASFFLFNAIRQIIRGQFKLSLNRFIKAGRFLFSKDNYWCFDYITTLEEKNNLRSYFYVCGKPKRQKRNLKQLLFDPGYNIENPKLRHQLQKLHNNGWIIGLHQSFNAWKDANSMYMERMYLEKTLKIPITTCRQHWLRFSWKHTWKAQQKAGLKLDTTLGFNDRPGFRNGVALEFNPWDFDSDSPMKLVVLPMVFMDSHFYNYADLNEIQRYNQIKYWLNEIYFVHGKATILWHVHVMSNDYGWKDGYEIVIKNVIEAKKRYDKGKKI